MQALEATAGHTYAALHHSTPLRRSKGARRWRTSGGRRGARRAAAGRRLGPCTAPAAKALPLPLFFSRSRPVSSSLSLSLSFSESLSFFLLSPLSSPQPPLTLRSILPLALFSPLLLSSLCLLLPPHTLFLPRHLFFSLSPPLPSLPAPICVPVLEPNVCRRYRQRPRPPQPLGEPPPGGGGSRAHTNTHAPAHRVT